MAGGVAPRASGGSRIDYDQLPADVRLWVERELGGAVVSTSTQFGGFSTGVAARVVTAEGRRAFVKAVSDDVNAQTPELFRHEIAVLTMLADVPYRAALRSSYDDGS